MNKNKYNFLKVGDFVYKNIGPSHFNIKVCFKVTEIYSKVVFKRKNQFVTLDNTESFINLEESINLAGYNKFIPKIGEHVIIVNEEYKDIITVKKIIWIEKGRIITTDGSSYKFNEVAPIGVNTFI